MTKLQYQFDDNGELISVVCPKYAFKFASVSGYSLEALRDKYLWFSKSSEFNDIFELPSKTPSEYQPEQVKEYLLKNVPYFFQKWGIELPEDLDSTIDGMIQRDPDLFASTAKKVQQVKKDLIRISCMSMRYDHTLMWAHYASSFSGFCLVFDFPQLIHNHPWFAVQVQYVDAAPTYDIAGTSMQHHKAVQPYSNKRLQFSHDQDEFGIKLKSWEYEQEVRLGSLDPDPKQSYRAQALTGIIFGPRITDEDRKAVEEAAKQGSGRLTFEDLIVDFENTKLEVPGLRNESVQLGVGGVRNLANEKWGKSSKSELPDTNS